jgi:flagellar hook-associated protein 2
MAITNETNRVNTLKAEKARLNKTQSVTTTLKTTLNSLKTAIDALVAVNGMDTKKTVSTDPLVSEFSATSAASVGAYSLNVTSLAASHKLGSSSLTDAGTTALTTEGAGVKTFRLQVGEVTEDISVTLAEGDTDNAVLAKLMDAISDGSKLAKAGLIKETSGSTALVIESRTSGTAGKVTITDLNSTLLKTTGVLNSAGTQARELQAASDAVFTIGGNLTITRSTNDVSDAITGVTINLKKLGATVGTVSTDVDAVAAKFTAFVAAYNAVQTAVGTQLTEATSTTDPEKGVFFGNRQMRAIRNSLRMRLAESRPLTLGCLSAVGIKPVDVKASSISESYNMKLDATVLKAALQDNPSIVQELVAGAAGILALTKIDVDSHLGVSTGTFASIETASSSRVTAVERRLSLAQKSVTQKTAYYTALYNSLAGKISGMQQQSMAAGSIYNSVYGTTTTS